MPITFHLFSLGLTATAFLTICAATLVYRPHKIYAEMFVVPVGAVFAFTSIRANLPGAPVGFGTIYILKQDSKLNGFIRGDDRFLLLYMAASTSVNEI